jgi:hypothetical protein
MQLECLCTNIKCTFIPSEFLPLSFENSLDADLTANCMLRNITTFFGESFEILI